MIDRSGLVILHDEDQEIGLCPRATMVEDGQNAADSLGRPLVALDAITGEVLASFHPRRAGRAA